MSVTVPASWPTIPGRGQHRPVWSAVARSYYGAPPKAMDLSLTSSDPGTLTKDAGTWPRTQLQLTVPEREANPHTVSDVLMPWATTVALTFGYVDQSGQPSTVLVATVRLIVTEADRPGGLLRLTCADRSSLTDAAQVAATQTYVAGTTVRAAILAAAAMDGLGAVSELNQLTGAQNAVTVPTGYSWYGSPWKAIEDLADLIGAEVFYDAAERLVLRTPPVPAITPLFTFTGGGAGVLTGMSSRVERAPNSVALVYDRANASGPVIGLWNDTRTGPTQLGGVYGTRRVVEERTGRPAQVQADAAAKAYGTRVAGRVRTVTYRAVPVPWIEPGDTIAVQPVDKGTAELHTVQSVTLPLNHDPMTFATRDASYLGPI